MCADSNATLAAQVDLSVGTVVSHKESPASQSFVDCLKRCALWALATFDEYADKCASTSFHTAANIYAGAGVRVDHVIVS